MSFNTISVIGLGYIGLPTAAMIALQGKKVIGVDINQHTIDIINQGKIHIVEPKLEEAVQKIVKDGLLSARQNPISSDAFLIAVPTPFSPSQSKNSVPKPDLSYIKSAIQSIAKVLKKGDLVILESTSPVGTTEKISVWLSKERPDLIFPNSNNTNPDINIAYCPERVLPGNVMHELVKNDRVIGGITKKCSLAAASLYKIFIDGECYLTSSKTAEMVNLT